MAETGAGGDEIKSFADVGKAEEKFWQESLEIHQKREAELAALRIRQANESDSDDSKTTNHENMQSQYQSSLEKAVADKSSQPSEVTSKTEVEKDTKIYDYFTVSTQPVLEATNFFGIFPGSEDEQALKLHSLPEKTVLEVNTKLGLRYFKESGPLIKRMLEGRTPSSENPKFIEFMLPAQKDTLVKDGWNVVKAYDLLPENKKL